MRKFMKIFVNMLTTSRLIVTILLMITFHNISQKKFLIIIALLFITDFIDGKLARKFKIQTMYGSKMDTIGDKALSIGLTILLLKRIPVMTFPLIGEIIISLINIIGIIRGKTTKSIHSGRIKMWIVSITIIIGYIYYFKGINILIIIISCLITFISQIVVILNYINFLKNKPIKKKEPHKESLLYRLFSTEYYLKNS